MIRPSAICTALAIAGVPFAIARAQPALREWKIGAAPTLNIGGDGSSQTEFFRVNATWRLPNGSMAIVNAGSGEIRIFDARGTYARAFGRSGAGPGEFRGMGWTGHAGDTAFVYDGNLRRITTIVLSGTPRMLTTLPVMSTDDRGFDVAGRVSDGRWLVHATDRPDVNLRGVQRIPGFTGLLGAGATGAVEWLAAAPDMAVFVYNPSSSPKMVSVLVPAFPPGFAVAAAGSSIWYGDAASDTIVRVDAVTGARKTVKLPDAPVPVTGEMADAARAREVAAARDQAARDVAEVKYSASYLPKRLPAFQALVPGVAGEVWVQAVAPSRAAPVRYVVVAANGIPLARVAVASGFRVTDVGRDYVVGVHRDDDGVETIRVYSLSR